jgi:hypothetical protein
MVLGLIGFDSKKILAHFFLVGTKMISEEYIHAPKTVVKPLIQRYCELEGNNMLKLDGALWHT